MSPDGPAETDSAASRAQPAFEFGDVIVATTDPADPSRVTELPADPLRRRAIGAAREALLRMRHLEEISDDAFHQVEEELDRAELSAQA